MSTENKVEDAVGRIRRRIVSAAVEKVATAEHNDGITTLSTGNVVAVSLDIAKMSKIKEDLAKAKVIGEGNVEETYRGTMYTTRHMSIDGMKELEEYAERQCAVNRAVRSKHMADTKNMGA